MQDEGYIRIQVGGHRKPTTPVWALVDQADAYLASDRWSLDKDGYPIRSVPLLRHHGRYRHERMSRAILGLGAGDPRQADHVNGVPLDNRRSNLRAVTNAQNAQNMAAHSDAISPYRGVSWFAPKGKWRARVCIDGRSYECGYYADELEAAEAARAFREAHMTHNVEARHVVLKPDA